jgi:Dolichyl-phosphate-mannose-protein mannosyltransferase
VSNAFESARSQILKVFAAVQEHPVMLWLIPAAIYVAAAIHACLVKPLWHDELFTYYVSRQVSAAGIIQSLLRTEDNLPPLDYLLRHFSMQVFGDSWFSFRLISLLGISLSVWAIREFTANVAGSMAGTLAALAVLGTTAFKMAAEARGTALLVPLAALALLLWQRAAAGSRGARAGLFLVLAAAPYAHYYGVLIYLPIACGEIARWLSQKRFNPGIWGAMALAGVTMAGLVPFMLAAHRFAAHFWSDTSPMAVVFIYLNLVGPLGVLALVTLGYIALFQPVQGPDPLQRFTRPLPEIAAACCLLALPLVAFVMARFTHSLAARYVLPMVLGGGFLIGYSICASGLRVTGLAGLVYCLLLGTFVFSAASWWRSLTGLRAAAQSQRQDFVQLLTATTEPVVLGNPFVFVQMSYFVGDPLKKRMVYIADPDQAVRFTGSDTADLAFDLLRSRAEITVERYAAFTKEHPSFTLVHSSANWVLKRLTEDSADLRVVGTFEGDLRYHAVVRPQ